MSAGDIRDRQQDVFSGRRARDVRRASLSRQARLQVAHIGVALCLTLGIVATGGVRARPAAASLSVTPSYNIVDLGTLPGGSSSSALAINAHGQIVGSATTSTDQEHAVLWQDRQIIDLGTLPGGTHSTAVAAGERGQIVGFSDADYSPTRAVLWQNGQITDLGTLPGDISSAATALNQRGQIVGSSSTHAVLWQAGRITDLGLLPGGTYSQAQSINDEGQVVGWADVPPPPPPHVSNHVFLWQAGTGMRDLGDPGTSLSISRATRDVSINSLGQVIAAWVGVGKDVHTYMWRDGAWSTELAPDYSGSDINTRGQTVGTLLLGVGLGYWARPALWPGPSGVLDLGTLANGRSGTAAAINDQGQIVGQSQIEPPPIGQPSAGPWHAVAWQPSAGSPPTTASQ